MSEPTSPSILGSEMFKDASRRLGRPNPELMPYQEQIMDALEGEHVVSVKMIPPSPDRYQFDDFRTMFLDRIAASLSLPYSVVAEGRRWDSWDCYLDPAMERVRNMIWRAASKRAHGFRGWQRKLKRARRIQRDSCGERTSDGWFTMQWSHARTWHDRLRYAQVFVQPLCDSFIAELSAETLTSKGWEKHDA